MFARGYSIRRKQILIFTVGEKSGENSLVEEEKLKRRDYVWNEELKGTWG